MNVMRDPTLLWRLHVPASCKSAKTLKADSPGRFMLTPLKCAAAHRRFVYAFRLLDWINVYWTLRKDLQQSCIIVEKKWTGDLVCTPLQTLMLNLYMSLTWNLFKNFNNNTNY